MGIFGKLFGSPMARLKHAAEQGDSSAQVTIGILYDNGNGFVQDHAEALKWYKLAGAQGDIFAKTHIVMMNKRGQGG